MLSCASPIIQLFKFRNKVTSEIKTTMKISANTVPMTMMACENYEKWYHLK